MYDPELQARTCFFTGHRSYKPTQARFDALDAAIEQKIDEGYDRFLAGGALGFDTYAALRVLLAKKRHPHVTLEIVVPCRTQAEKWSARDRELYEQILGLADAVTVLSETYYDGCMLVRNQKMVLASGACIAFLDEMRGGTAYTVRLAQERGLPIVNLGSYPLRRALGQMRLF